jgi:hypothetical protein
VHVVAPTAARLLVIDPGKHTAHADVDWALYWPAAHAVQLTPPVDVSESAIEPAPHVKQADWPALLWYCPAPHSSHACVDAALY